MFRNLKEETKKNFNSKEKSIIIFFLVALLLFLPHSCFPNHHFAQIIYSHVCYAMAYYHKKFQNFNIKTLTIIACLNFKNWLWAFRG